MDLKHAPNLAFFSDPLREISTHHLCNYNLPVLSTINRGIWRSTYRYSEPRTVSVRYISNIFREVYVYKAPRKGKLVTKMEYFVVAAKIDNLNLFNK